MSKFYTLDIEDDRVPDDLHERREMPKTHLELDPGLVDTWVPGRFATFSCADLPEPMPDLEEAVLQVGFSALPRGAKVDAADGESSFAAHAPIESKGCATILIVKSLGFYETGPQETLWSPPDFL